MVQLCNILWYIYSNNILIASINFYNNNLPTENPKESNPPFHKSLRILKRQENKKKPQSQENNYRYRNKLYNYYKIILELLNNEYTRIIKYYKMIE